MGQASHPVRGSASGATSWDSTWAVSTKGFWKHTGFGPVLPSSESSLRNRSKTRTKAKYLHYSMIYPGWKLRTITEWSDTVVWKTLLLFPLKSGTTHTRLLVPPPTTAYWNFHSVQGEDTGRILRTRVWGYHYVQISLDTWDIRKNQLKTTVNSKISQWESRMRKRDTEISRLRINDPLLRRHKNNHSKSIRA